MPYVASESTASNAVYQQAGRQSFADRASTRSGGNFDDLLNAIPDALPQPQPPAPTRADAPAPERRPAPEARATARNDRQDPPRPANKTDRADPRDQSGNPAAKSADDAPSQAASQDKTDKTASDAAGDEKAAKGGTAEAAKDADASAAAQEAATAAAQQVTTPAATAAAAVVVDPAAAVAVAVDASATAGDAATGGKAAAAAVVAAATATTGKATEQPAAAANAATELTADDADVLSALAAKAQQGLKDAQEAKTGKSDKGDTKAAAGDKPADTVKAGANPLAALDPNAAQPASGDAKDASAKPAQGEAIAKLSGEAHQSGEKKPAADAAALTPAVAAAKAPDLALPQNLVPTAHGAQAAAAATATSGSGKASGDDAPVSISNVAVEVTSKIASGKNQFDIRLDPPDLGKIHVKVNVDRDGNVITHMVADRSDTLDLLRRDTSDLQRALQDAGLKTSDNSLQFSLRDQTANQQQSQQQGQAGRLAVDDEQATTNTATIIARDYGAYGSRTGGLDIRV